LEALAIAASANPMALENRLEMHLQGLEWKSAYPQG
jgi:hypothetical protein